MVRQAGALGRDPGPAARPAARCGGASHRGAGRRAHARGRGGRICVRNPVPEGAAAQVDLSPEDLARVEREQIRVRAALRSWSEPAPTTLAMQLPLTGPILEPLRRAALLQSAAAQSAHGHGHRRADRHADQRALAGPVVDVGDYFFNGNHRDRPRPWADHDVLPPVAHRRADRRRRDARRADRTGRRHRPRDRAAPALRRRAERALFVDSAALFRCRDPIRPSAPCALDVP